MAMVDESATWLWVCLLKMGPLWSWTPLGFYSLLPGSQSFHKGTCVLGWLPNYCCWGKYEWGTSYSAILLMSPPFFLFPLSPLLPPTTATLINWHLWELFSSFSLKVSLTYSASGLKAPVPHNQSLDLLNGMRVKGEGEFIVFLNHICMNCCAPFETGPGHA